MVRSEEDDDTEVSVEALVASGPTSEANEAVLSDLILQLIVAAKQLEVLLTEAEPNEVRAVGVRLGELKRMVGALPSKGTPRPAMGFTRTRGGKKQTKRK